MIKKIVTTIAYEDRLCLFLDILGFKSMVQETVKDFDTLANPAHKPMTVLRIHGGLKIINESMTFDLSIFNDLVNTSKRVTQFSDNIVVSYSMSDPSAVFDMLYDIYLLQVSLIQSGFFVRGAITSGKLFHDESMVFGPALVEAAELEKLAMYPRVILSPQLLKKGRLDYHGNPDQTVMRLVKEDLDGMYYIDYFGVNPGEFDEGWSDLYNHLVELQEMIRRLSVWTGSPSIKLKHSWLRKKFNELTIPLEESRFTKLNGFSIPDHLQPAFLSIIPLE